MNRISSGTKDKETKKQRHKSGKRQERSTTNKRISSERKEKKKQRCKSKKAKKLRLNNEQNIICKENIKKSRNKERTKERKKHTKKQRKRCYRDVQLEY